VLRSGPGEKAAHALRWPGHVVMPGFLARVPSVLQTRSSSRRGPGTPAAGYLRRMPCGGRSTSFRNPQYPTSLLIARFEVKRHGLGFRQPDRERGERLTDCQRKGEVSSFVCRPTWRLRQVTAWIDDRQHEGDIGPNSRSRPNCYRRRKWCGSCGIALRAGQPASPNAVRSNLTIDVLST
jgi:hypothetical protein